MKAIASLLILSCVVGIYADTKLLSTLKKNKNVRKEAARLLNRYNKRQFGTGGNGNGIGGGNGACGQNQFTCNNGDCQPSSWECDGWFDCDDGEDEYCGYVCYDGETIDWSLVCDGNNDCSGGEEEEWCESESGEDDDFWCDDEVTISWSLVCDGVDNCLGGEDELELWCGDYECDAEESYECEDGWCIPNSWKCDGFPDCSNLDDEINCEPCVDFNPCVYGSCGQTSEAPFYECTCEDTEDGSTVDGQNCDIVLVESKCEEDTCHFESKMQIRREMNFESGPGAEKRKAKKKALQQKKQFGVGSSEEEDQFICNDGTAFPDWFECDWYDDCADGEDEADCECEEEHHFFCGDGSCVPGYFKCDGEEQCDDGSDEICGFVTVGVTLTVLPDSEDEIRAVLEVTPSPFEDDARYQYEANIPDIAHSSYRIHFGSYVHFEALFDVAVLRSEDKLNLEAACYRLSLKEVLNVTFFHDPGTAEDGPFKRRGHEKKRKLERSLEGEILDPPPPPDHCLMICTDGSDGVFVPCDEEPDVQP